jgi:hypothetical protein
VGIRDELERTFGTEFFTPTTERRTIHNWHELCVCGHLDRYHSESVGGTYRLPEPFIRSIAGEAVTVSTVFAGCTGAMSNRGFEAQTETVDRESLTILNRINPSCPCVEFRAVAKVDRPNRYFNQRMPRDRSDAARHPFVTGVRAFTTHLSKRRAALSDPTWPDREFDRRFVWLDDARVCSISKCRETADVWPVFVITDPADGLSELRCPAHR